MDSLFRGCTDVSSDGIQKLILRNIIVLSYQQMCLERCGQCNYSYKNKVNDKEKDKVVVKKRIFYLIIIQYSVFFLSKTSVVGFLSLF